MQVQRPNASSAKVKRTKLALEAKLSLSMPARLRSAIAHTAIVQPLSSPRPFRAANRATLLRRNYESLLRRDRRVHNIELDGTLVTKEVSI
jgi:hypothetical protein